MDISTRKCLLLKISLGDKVPITTVIGGTNMKNMKKKKERRRKKGESGSRTGDVERRENERKKEERSLIPYQYPYHYPYIHRLPTMNKACLSSKKCVASTSRLVAATQNKVRQTHKQTHHWCGG